MAKGQINVRLDEDLAKRLEALARRTGRIETFSASNRFRIFWKTRRSTF
jgi:predicted transcriptional regulator